MASRAERQRRRKARVIAAAAAEAEAPAPAAPAARPVVIEETPAPGRDDGLDWLERKSRINRRQAQAGRYFGMIWRTAKMEGGAPVRVADLEGARGGARMGATPILPVDQSAWIVDCRLKLERAHAALGFNAVMIATLELICGAGVRPREITTEQRATEQIETALRLALDNLAHEFDVDLARAGRVRGAG